jgi:pimeloyl-ACP methyl ester carboxylesterase
MGASLTITHRTVQTNSISMHIAEAGEGPLVVLLHGFPESWYSYRHQLEALSGAGYHAVAPDQRGYGGTDSPEEIDKYTQLHLVGDIVGLVASLGERQCVVVGHDWGSPVAANLGVLRPDLVRGVALLSVPYGPRGDVDTLTALTQRLGPDNYQQRFQAVGVAEAALEAHLREMLLRSLYALSGDAPLVSDPGLSEPLTELPKGPLPGWLTDEDVDYLVGQFERSGLRGPLNWYRNSKANWELLAAWHHAPLLPPSLFIGGDRDIVFRWFGTADPFKGLRDYSMPNLTKAVVLEGCGHWTQQERSDEVNELLLDFLAGLPS